MKKGIERGKKGRTDKERKLLQLLFLELLERPDVLPENLQ